MPTVIAMCQGEMQAKATSIINEAVLEEFSKNFNYNEVIDIEKDEEGNITLLKANTLILNKIATDVSIKAQSRLRDMGIVGIKLPVGYILKNNILASIGPSVTVKMQPIGYIEVSYLSDFESAGINQTRHKIYVRINTKLKIILPYNNSEVDIKKEVAIAETIIVGKIPKTPIGLNLNQAGLKIKN